MARNSSLTILTPTYQRSYFVERKLHNLALQGCPYPLIVLDSSSPEVAARNREIVAAHDNSLEIDYRHLGGESHFAEKLGAGAALVKTPYTVFSFDDDFINVAAIDEGVACLARDNKFSSASGIILNLVRSHGAVDGAERILIKGKSDVFDDDSPDIRIRRFLTSNQLRNPIFNIWRSEFLQEMIGPVARTPWKKSSELLFDHVATYSGPTKSMETVLEARHTDYSKDGYRSHGLPDFTLGFERDLLDEDFRIVLKDMLRIGSKYLRAASNKSEEQIRKEIIGNYIRHRIKKNYWNYAVDPEARPRGALDSWAGRKVRRLLHVAATVNTPGKAAKFVRTIKLYGINDSLDLLASDPKFECNHIALTAPGSPHAAFVNTICQTLEVHPEPVGIDKP